MGGPSSVCNASMRVEDFGHIDTRLVNKFSELGHLAQLFEGKDLISLVTIYSQTSRVITTVFKTGETVDKGIEDKLAVLLDQVVNVAEYATARLSVVERFNEEKQGCVPHVV